jgi:hexosaminidase
VDANPTSKSKKNEITTMTKPILNRYNVKKHNKRLMGWEEIMTKDMSKDAIIRVERR